MRQRPGSTKGVIFITIEDETGIANIVIWPTLFERSRRVVLGAGMMAINGRIQREGDVVYLVAQQLFDLSTDLSGLAERDATFRPPIGRGDEFAHGSPGSPDSRARSVPGVRARDMFVPDLHIGVASSPLGEAPAYIAKYCREDRKIVRRTVGGSFIPANTSPPALCAPPRRQGSPSDIGRSTGSRNRCIRQARTAGAVTRLCAGRYALPTRSTAATNPDVTVRDRPEA